MLGHISLIAYSLLCILIIFKRVEIYFKATGFYAFSTGVKHIIAQRWYVRNVKSRQMQHFSLIPNPGSVPQLHFLGSVEFGGALLLSLGLTSTVFSCSTVRNHWGASSQAREEGAGEVSPFLKVPFCYLQILSKFLGAKLTLACTVRGTRWMGYF